MTKKLITRRTSLLMAGAAAAAPLASVRAQQTGLPDKPLKILVGFPAGGGTDVMARFLAEPLKQRTGRNVLIDNKAGASGTIAIETLKNSPPDGTTIAYVPSATITCATAEPAIVSNTPWVLPPVCARRATTHAHASVAHARAASSAVIAGFVASGARRGASVPSASHTKRRVSSYSGERTRAT